MLLQWIKVSLEKKIITSTIGVATTITEKGEGCPHGGVLSFLQCTTLVDDLIRNLPRRSYNSQVTYRSQFPNTLADNWCEQKRLSLTAQETQVITFTKKRMIEDLHPIWFHVSKRQNTLRCGPIKDSDGTRISRKHPLRRWRLPYTCHHSSNYEVYAEHQKLIEGIRYVPVRAGSTW